MPFCPKCGVSVAQGALFCPSCGVSLAATNASSPSGPPSPPMWGGPPPTPLTVNYSKADAVAIGKIKMFALIGIVGIALGLIIPLALGFSFTSVFGITPGTSPSSAALRTLLVIAVSIAIVGFAMGFVSTFLVRSGFSTLSTVDGGFSTPSMMVLGLFAGMGLLIIGFILLIAFIYSVAGGTASASAAMALLGALILVVIGGIADLVGIIGLILGLWKAGERYDETILKVGGILFIIPYADIVAPILVFIGALNAQKKVAVAIKPPSM